MVPFESLGAVTCSISTVTMALFCISSDIARYWSKIVIFHDTLAFGALVRGGGVTVGILPSVWYGKTRMVGQPDGEKNFDRNRLHTIPACDGQTDKQTSCHGIDRAMHMRSAVKTNDIAKDIRTKQCEQKHCHRLKLVSIKDDTL